MTCGVTWPCASPSIAIPSCHCRPQAVTEVSSSFLDAGAHDVEQIDRAVTLLQGVAGAIRDDEAPAQAVQVE